MASFFTDPIIFTGFLIVIGISTSFLFQKLGVPHIVAYIGVGFILSNTIYSDIDLVLEHTELFEIVESIALGLIGFKIGTELKLKELSKQSKELTALLIGNAGGAFIVVTGLVFLFTPNYTLSQRLILSIILGGVATATAPAATVEIIRKYKSKGALTTIILAVLALDDVVAVILVEIILVFVKASLGSGFDLAEFLFGIFREIGYALILGAIVGISLDSIVEKMHDDLEMMELTLGVLVLTIGITHFIHTSVILTTMVIGITVTNLRGDNYEKAGDLLEIIMSPIVTLFFVMVGAKVRIVDFTPFPYLMLVYFIARLLGKYYGSYLAAKGINASNEVRKNLGLGMFAQGGVALGLASVISEALVTGGEIELARMVVSIIIVATVFSESIGTIAAKFALTRAGEIQIEKLPTQIVDADHIRVTHLHE